MNREDAKVFKFINYNRIINSCIIDVNELNKHIDKIYDDFAKDLKEINNQVLRLKKQLANNHHIECSCSFCKPVDEKVLKEFTFTSCDDCKNKIYGTYQEICGNCKRFYGCYFEAKEV